MNQEELTEILKTHEWRDVEFKEAQQKVPKSAYETVSAFANTEGGHLVFGVRKENEDFEVVGVLDVDKVQNEFLSTLRQPDKISVALDIKEGLFDSGADLLEPGEKEVSLSELKAVTGLTGPDAINLVNSLVTQMLLKPLVVGGRYALAEHLQSRFTNNISTAQVPHKKSDLSTAQLDADKPNLSTEQVQPLKEPSETHWKIIDLCEVPRRLAAIMEAVRISNRGYFKTKHLNPLIRIGLVVMTNPDNPRASNQKYVITEAGAK